MVEQKQPEEQFRSIESDEEIHEAKEEAEDETTSSVTFTGALPDKFELVVCNGKLARTLADMAMAPEWTEIGKGETTSKDKTKTGMEFYTANNGQTKRVVLRLTDEYKSSAVNDLMSAFFTQT